MKVPLPAFKAAMIWLVFPLQRLEKVQTTVPDNIDRQGLVDGALEGARGLTGPGLASPALTLAP
jgi:hypothetical protein